MSVAGAAIGIDQLTVIRGGRAVLDRLTLEVEAGTVTGLLGPSGCGKSTLMRSIVGVQVVASGSVGVLGLPAGSPSLRERVGYLTQAPSVYGDLTVRENLRYFGRIAAVGPGRVEEVIATVRLGALADRVVAGLSGGERARVSLASALIAEPELLILDEPTVGLDPVLRRELWALFAELAADGTTLLISSHVMDEASHCDRLLLMREGAILASGPPAELIARTGTADIGAAFLALIEGPAA